MPEDAEIILNYFSQTYFIICSHHWFNQGRRHSERPQQSLGRSSQPARRMTGNSVIRKVHRNSSRRTSVHALVNLQTKQKNGEPRSVSKSDNAENPTPQRDGNPQKCDMRLKIQPRLYGIPYLGKIIFSCIRYIFTHCGAAAEQLNKNRISGTSDFFSLSLNIYHSEQLTPSHPKI